MAADRSGKPEDYRAGVGIMLLSQVGLVFIGRRRGKRPADQVTAGHEWQMPQGGIDEGEEPLEAAHRELAEETGVTKVQLLAESADWFSYDLPPDLSRKHWKRRYLGQRQKWFAFRFLGDDSDINILHPAGGHKAEFDAWRWEKMELLPELVIPFKRDVYDRVVKEFGYLAGSP